MSKEDIEKQKNTIGTRSPSSDLLFLPDSQLKRIIADAKQEACLRLPVRQHDGPLWKQIRNEHIGKEIMCRISREDNTKLRGHALEDF